MKIDRDRMLEQVCTGEDACSDDTILRDLDGSR
jgi:hypothetical protein